MADQDLSRLRIDRNVPRAASRRRFRWWWLLLIVLAVGGAYALYARNAPLAVETATVSQAYPSQAHTLLNATGYVVAQRKAAVASKATGRLEWLNVREGSVVKAGAVEKKVPNASGVPQDLLRDCLPRLHKRMDRPVGQAELYVIDEQMFRPNGELRSEEEYSLVLERKQVENPTNNEETATEKEADDRATESDLEFRSGVVGLAVDFS